jgi:hypothetical protein
MELGGENAALHSEFREAVVRDIPSCARIDSAATSLARGIKEL